jgi:hypothetical protein
MSALVKKVNELAAKVGIKPLSSTASAKLPAWKRWVGGEGPDHDVTGLRDVVNTNAIYTDQIKGDVDSLGDKAQNHESRIRALEAAPISRPFP